MRARYTQRVDNEGFTVPSETIHRIACCDCGLVHDFVFVSEDGKPIGIAARRNNRATAQRRRFVIVNASRMNTNHPAGQRAKRDTKRPCAVCGWSEHMAIHQPVAYGARTGEPFGHVYHSAAEAINHPPCRQGKEPEQ